MIKISDAVQDIVTASPVLTAGIHEGILNLSRTARWIQPLVESRVQKPATPSAIVMALSRLQRDALPVENPLNTFRADRINLQTGLTAVTYPRQADVQEGTVAVYSVVRGKGEYITVTDGMREILVIVEESRLPYVRDTIPTAPIQVRRDLASISVSLKPHDLHTPGILYRILQPLAMQNLSLVEITSTTTEFHIYVERSDAMLAMDSMFKVYG